jgi:hypothetical protein
VAGAGRRAVVWCPPGGHGRYVGSVVAVGGELRAVCLTVAELRRLVVSASDAEPRAAAAAARRGAF